MTRLSQYHLVYIVMMFFYSGEALSDNSTLTMKGTVIEQSCIVSPSDINKVVNLGAWSVKQIQSVGHSDAMPFKLQLSGCTASGVSINFQGNKSTDDNTLLALSTGSTAKGVAIELTDEARHRIVVGENSPRIAIGRDGSVTLQYFARYVTTSTPSAGTADADSVYTLTYD
ncbi:adhesin [Enterobacteriaceae bacterium ML5]|nr:adhesin [Enterobacteriaceae bacterium ML5]